MRKLILLSTLFAVAAVAAAYAADPAMTAQTAKGLALTDAKGMTLYVWDKDAAGKATCNGACAKNWPPFMAPAGATPSGDYTIVTRDDGTMQWAYKGKPLYGWIKDTKPGDVTGDGVAGTWHIATP